MSRSRRQGKVSQRAAIGSARPANAMRRTYGRRWLRRAQRGQSMVEMAILLPIFLLLIFSVMEIGRAWGAKHGITSAAREGARVMVLPHGLGAAYGTPDAVHAAAVNAANSYLDSVGLSHQAPIAQVTPIWADPVDGIYGNGNDVISDSFPRPMMRGDKVGIKILYRFETPLPLILLSGQSPIMMSATVLMEHE